MQTTVAPSRVVSIDILRALTMVLMVFVNDLWSLSDIPAWLEHVEHGVDGIGLADVVFPAFLFIVGLSMPFALDARRKKGDTTAQLIQHITWRGLALLIMGLFLVNGESYNEEASSMPRVFWNPLCCFCFILIWNAYPKNKSMVGSFGKLIGAITLLTLAIIYRGGDAQHIEYFKTHWWGILGLIGWAYLASGLITLFAHHNLAVLIAAWAFFAVLSMLSHTQLIPAVFNPIPEAIRGGTLTGLSLGGVVISTLFVRFRANNDNKALTITFVAISIGLIILSVVTRPYWGLAKLGATPAWLFLCSAFTILAFLAVYWIADVAGRASWFSILKPAGTDTLLCYLIPYFAYAFTNIFGLHLPGFALHGPVGLLKSLLFAILCAVITGGLGRLGVRLKL